MKVLVCGGRSYSDWQKVHQLLDSLHRRFRITQIIQGCAPGADLHGSTWADKNGIQDTFYTYKADWNDLDAEGAVPRQRDNGTFYNAMAGFDRNHRMIIDGKPDMVVAFGGGKGTAHMVGLGVEAEIPTLVVPTASLPDPVQEDDVVITFPDAPDPSEPYWAFPPSRKHTRVRADQVTPAGRYEAQF